MKALICVLTFFICTFVNMLIGKAIGIRAGAVLLYIVEFYLAKKLFEKWDARNTEKRTEAGMNLPTEQIVEKAIPKETTTELFEQNESVAERSMPAVAEEKIPEVAVPVEQIIMDEAPALKYRFCRKCGFELLKDSAFCSKCGSPVVEKIVCPSCGKELTEQSAFCHYCGTKI